MWRWVSGVCFCLLSWSTEAQDPGRYDVVLHEIFADPTPSRGLPASEFIELRNRSAAPVQLRNWTIKTGSSTGRINVNIILQPDSMVILCGASAATSFQPYGQTVVVTSFPSLNNDGDSLMLYSGSGKLIHGLVWSKNWYKNELKEEGGWSLEMKDIRFSCDFSENWNASIDPKGGTPGKPNSIKEIVQESTLPKLLYSYILGKKDLFLQFSKPINPLTAQIILDPHLAIAKIEEVPPLFTSLSVRLQTEADSTTLYRATVSGVRTCQAEVINQSSIRTGMLISPGFQKIVINEILFNPPVGGSDFIELLNLSNHVLNAGALRIANRSSDGKISSITTIHDQPYPIFPGEHILVTADPEWIKAKYLPPDTITSLATSLPSYPDDKGSAVLLDEQGTILDELTYDEKWHFTLLTNKESISLERVNPKGKTQESGNWHSASGTNGYATPGYRNSQQFDHQSSGKYFSLNTKIISPDNDGQDDYMMLTYDLPAQGAVMTIRIYDAAGREITKLANNRLCGNTGQFRWDGYTHTGKKVSRGFYILLAEAFFKNGEVLRFKDAIAVYEN
ncbi:MAG: lamin tail domain-containing protein [Sphingobacteriales bacterium]